MELTPPNELFTEFQVAYEAGNRAEAEGKHENPTIPWHLQENIPLEETQIQARLSLKAFTGL